MNLLPVCVLVIAGATTAQPGIVAIGDLPGSVPVSGAYGVSADGSVVTGISYGSGGGIFGGTMIRWTREGGLEALPRVPDSSDNIGGTFSPSAEFIAGAHGSTGLVWSRDLGTVSVGSLPGGRDTSSVGQINNEGMTVGSASFDFTVLGAPLNRAIKWTPAGGLEALPLPEPSDLGFNSRASHILADGRIFGHSNSGTWLYSEQAGFEMLPVGSYMNQINSTGDFMIGTNLVNDPWPFRSTYWTPDTGEVQLEPLGSIASTSVIRMSEDGSVIVGEASNTGFIIWLDQGTPMLLTDYAESLGIDMSGWFIERVTSISADGTTIIGIGAKLEWSGTNRSEGFVLTIPTPGAAVVLGISGLLACRRRR